MVKRLPTMRETWVQSLGWKDLLEKEMATHSSILAWKIPWTEEPGSYSPWGHKESDTEWLHFLGGEMANASVSILDSEPLPTEVKNSSDNWVNLVMTKGPVWSSKMPGMTVLRRDASETRGWSQVQGTPRPTHSCPGPARPTQEPWEVNSETEGGVWAAPHVSVYPCAEMSHHQSTEAYAAMPLMCFSALCLSC